MRWVNIPSALLYIFNKKQVDDLDPPYTKYAQVFVSAFNEWDPIKNNVKLPMLLADFSSLHPPTPIEPSSVELTWTLDGLLALPRVRLKYYKRLYGRLLKSTSSGRSDYQLLQVANDKLDRLMAQIETRSNIRAESSSLAETTPLVVTLESDLRHEIPPMVVSEGSSLRNDAINSPASRSESSAHTHSTADTPASLDEVKISELV